MSDVHVTMKFELLPNEILVECLDYLNAVYIFHSFNQLNSHFNKLIRSIPLHLDFENVHQGLICDQFCMNILSNQEIKKQIYSIYLSNKDSYYPIQSFLSKFSLEEFIHLRSLTLNKISEKNFKQLKLMLPLLTNLSYFRMNESRDKQNEILSLLPISQLRSLSVKKLPSNFEYILNNSLIVNLILNESDWSELYKLLMCKSRLKSLKIERIFQYGWNKKINSISNPNSSLQQLIIKVSEGEFDYFQIILKQTPNLKNLTIDAYGKIDLIDAKKWQDLIITSLPYLNIFKFNFECLYKDDKNKVLEKFQEFQNDFWYKQHHWYTEYVFSTSSASIYTIPYVFPLYKIKSYTTKQLNSYINIFDNVKELVIFPIRMTEDYQYHFPHIISLTIGISWPLSGKDVLTIKHLDYLKRIIHFFHIKQLIIIKGVKLETPFVLTTLLQDIEQLSSLKIPLDILMPLFNDEESCKYLNKMIKILDIQDSSDYSLNFSYEIQRFCQIFTNIEQLKCTIHQRETLLFIIQHLSKLTYIDICSWTTALHNEIYWLELEVQKLGIKIIYEIFNDKSSNLSIWIMRDLC